jgi:hypothetical protein
MLPSGSESPDSMSDRSSADILIVQSASASVVADFRALQEDRTVIAKIELHAFFDATARNLVTDIVGKLFQGHYVFSH